MTGQELARRVNGPEQLRSSTVLGQLLAISKASGDPSGMGHTQKELQRLVSLVAEGPKRKPLYGPFTLLPEGEIFY